MGQGVGSDAQLGILVQHLLGRLFSTKFAATEESWSAAKVRRAKRLLASMVDDDLSAVNAIGIAVRTWEGTQMNLVIDGATMLCSYGQAYTDDVFSLSCTVPTP